MIRGFTGRAEVPVNGRVKPGHDGGKTAGGVGLAVLLAFLVFGAPPSRAGVLDRVRRDAVLHCGAAARSAVAEDRGDGTIGGLAVDLCRAVAVAVAGPRARIAFRVL